PLPHHPPLPSPTSSRHNTTTATTPSRQRVRLIDINSLRVHWFFIEALNRVYKVREKDNATVAKPDVLKEVIKVKVTNRCFNCNKKVGVMGLSSGVGRLSVGCIALNSSFVSFFLPCLDASSSPKLASSVEESILLDLPSLNNLLNFCGWSSCF
nr:A20/AN1-like zinc finger family protein [Tanacetum cinerariifolium]